MAELVTLTTFCYRHQAEFYRGVLEGSGIEALVTSDDCGGLRPNFALASGVQLVVREEDVVRARLLLESRVEPVD
jgi:hypothetical protein